MSAREPRTIRLAEDRWSTVRHIVEAVAIVAAGLWGFYVFIYQERIKPASEPAALTSLVTIERIGRDARREILRITTTFRNTGKTEIDLAAEGYNVWGERYGTREIAARKETSNTRALSYLVPLASKKLIASRSELRDAAVGGRKGFHIIIEPGTQEALSDVLVVPRGAYDVIDAQALAVPVKTPVTEPVAVQIQHLPDGSSFLQPRTPGVSEDDNETQFALIP